MNPPPLLSSLPAALWALAIILPAAQAGSPPVSAMVPPAGAPPRNAVELSSQFEFGDASPAGPGGNVFENRITLPLFVPLSQNWRLIGALRGGLTDYETSPFGDGGMQTWNVGGFLSLKGQLNEEWSLTLGGLAGASWEDGASFSDSWNGGGLMSLDYRLSPTLKLGLGALYLTRQNEDALVVPALGLEWQVSDNFDITLRGLDLRAEYDLDAAWSVYLRGEFDPNGALLNKRPGSEADAFNDQAFRAAAGVKWTPCGWFSLSMEGGVAFHEYTLLNDAAEILAKDRVDPAPFVGVSARLSF